MGRRRFNNTVSFFAFQDIITAVMGILILIVLLLSVLVSQTVEAQSQMTSSESDTTAEISSDELDSLRIEVASLENQLDQVVQMLNVLAQLDSEEQVREQISQNELRLETLNQAISAALAAMADLESEIEIEEGRKAALERNLGLTEKKSRASALQDEIERITTSQRVTYNFRNLQNRTPWLVMLEADKVTLGRAGIAEKPTSISGATVNKLARGFSDWQSKQPGGTTHIVFLVKPGSIDLYRQVKDMVRTKGMTVGFEPFPASKTVFDPVRGAAL